MADDARLKVILELKDLSAKGFQSFKNSVGAVTRSVFSLQGGLAALGVSLTGREIFQAGRNMLQLEKSFTEITGSAEAMGKEFDFVRELSDRMGQNFYDLIPAYKGVLAASKDTVLEGENTRAIFEGITKASASLGLSSDQTVGALRAVEQIMSKGKVQAEELRGQLGERLPGAFKLAAKAMGITTSQLNTMLDRGEVLAEDLLPRLAEVLKSEYSGEVDAATRAVNKFDESWQDLKNSMADSGFIDSIADSIGNVADVFKDEDFKRSMSDLAENVGNIVEGLSKLTKYAGLRSISDTASKGAELADQGLIDWEEFIRASFIKRQRMVDEILKSPRFAGGYPDFDTAEQIESKVTERKIKVAVSIDEKEWRKELDELDKVIDQSNRDLADTIGYDVDYGFNPAQAARQKLEIERDLRELQAAVNIAANAGIEDTYGVDVGNISDGVEEEFDRMIQLSQRTADAMEQNFSDLFFDAMTGQFKDIGDYWDALMNSMKRAFADFMGQLVKEFIFGKDQITGGGDSGFLSLLKGITGLFSSSSSVESYGTDTYDIDFGGARAYGGPVTPGTSYLVGENGPELFSPAMAGNISPGAGSGSISVPITINDYAGANYTVREERDETGRIRGIAIDAISKALIMDRGFRNHVRRMVGD